MSKSTITVVLSVDGYETTKVFKGKGVGTVVSEPETGLTWFGFIKDEGIKLQGAVKSALLIAIDF